ncbi:UDP-3-O-glucosamine N-acyltransferase [Flagelloscypha sp. PMI_526]|nr:UDP-3-O-glucosamine N-acyltransferase [Flagelloscypha sp. PMI_526]
MNFLDGEPEAQRLPREFLAVVLAGFGNELVPLTANHGDTSTPKALLPIANTPLLSHTLSWIEQSGITDVLLICPASHRPAISHCIASSALNIDIQSTDESQETSIGTCALLRQFSSRIKEDFVLLPCDLVPSTLRLSTLLDKFRTDVVSSGTIATACWLATEKPEKSQFPEEWLPSDTTSTPIIYDKITETLLYVDSYDTLEKDGEILQVRMGLLNRYPRVALTSKYTDSHIYVCKHVVLDALAEKHSFDSVRQHFFPWLCKVQYQKAKLEKYGHILTPSKKPSQSLALHHSTLQYFPHFDDAESDQEEGSQASSGGPASPIRISVVIHDGMFPRANTLINYFWANRKLQPKEPYSLPVDTKDRALIDQKAQISTDSMVGESTQISERAVIKRTIIGRHCTIGKMVKIVNCILLDHCVVHDGVKLEGCILGNNTTVGAKAELIKCITQPGYEVAAEELFKNEKLDVSDWAAESEADSTEDNSEENETGSDDDDTEEEDSD